MIKKGKDNRTLLNEVLENVKHDMSDKEILDMLTDCKIANDLKEKNIDNKYNCK